MWIKITDWSPLLFFIFVKFFCHQSIFNHSSAISSPILVLSFILYHLISLHLTAHCVLSSVCSQWNSLWTASLYLITTGWPLWMRAQWFTDSPHCHPVVLCSNQFPKEIFQWHFSSDFIHKNVPRSDFIKLIWNV